MLQRMDEMATDWKTLVHPDSPLADYGENQNLLECAPAYIDRVASCNAQNVWMMRQDAALQELKGNAARARELRDDAEKLLPAVLSLYKPGDGVWYGLHNDGKRVELRHCVDYIYVGNALANDLTPDMRREMTDFVKRELLMRDWMRAMSLKDAAAAISDRPDHGPMGAYDGWPALTVGTMWRLGFPNDAFDFYCRTAEVTKEGPFAQAREFYGPHRDQYDAPVRIAERDGCMKECISGARSRMSSSTRFSVSRHRWTEKIFWPTRRRHDRLPASCSMFHHAVKSSPSVPAKKALRSSRSDSGFPRSESLPKRAVCSNLPPRLI